MDSNNQYPQPHSPCTSDNCVKKSRAQEIKQRFFADRRDIQLGNSTLAYQEHSISTGFDSLDRRLPGGGWPLGALTEILIPDYEPGTLWITLPALASLSRQQRWMAMVSPPHMPYAPALAAIGLDLNKILLIRPKSHTDVLWTIEEALKSGTCSSVLFWLNQSGNKVLRRLQLAAERSNALAICFRPEYLASQRTSAALRIKVSPRATGLVTDILKCRGGRPHQGLNLNFSDIGYC
ncbi:MAG: hypothetical protein ACI9FD_000237 [Gammaproteobacteria bacterium]|jgi:hypothetical protein